MRLLSEAIESFSEAAERLDRAVLRVERRSSALAEGAEAQGDVILRLRGDIETLKQALEEGGVSLRRGRFDEAEHDRIEPFWAAG